MGFGQLVSKVGGFTSKLGSLVSKSSRPLGMLATPIKGVVSVAGALADPLTGGLSGKVAGIVNKGLSYVADGGLNKVGSAMQNIGGKIQNVGGALSS